MINPGKDITDIINSGNIVIAVLLSFGFPSAAGGTGNVTDTDDPISVVGSGGGTTRYNSATGITAISVPAQQQGIQRDIYTVHHVDSSPGAVGSWRYRYTSAGWVGINLKVDTVFRKSDKTHTDPLGVFAGHCIGVVEEPNDGGGTVLIAKFAGELEQIGANRIVMATDNYMRGIDATDNSLAYINSGVNVPWGEGPTD